MSILNFVEARHLVSRTGIGTEWNEGADLHWREWGTLIPVAGIFIGIWNGLDCANGMTAHEFAEQNAANWY